MQKLIKMDHHVHDYECMWNGIEDLYMNRTGERLPESFFFILSGFGSFCYLKTNQADLKRMVALGDGRTQKMYEFLAPIIGMDYKHHSYKRFSQALHKAKSEIDAGFPVVLGALDMYYLPYYPKLYHGEHIPFHYVLMAGYNEEKQCILLYDCGRPELLKLSYAELEQCMDCSYPGLSKENTVCTVRLSQTRSREWIAAQAFKKKAEQFLNPPAGFLGYKGFEKFIRELPDWREELGKEEYDKLLTHLVTFFGTVPTLPNAVKGIDEPDEVVFKGGFDKMSRVLSVLGEEEGKENWLEAAALFGEGADTMEEISRIMTAYLAHKEDQTERLQELFTDVLEKMKAGFSLLRM